MENDTKNILFELRKDHHHHHHHHIYFQTEKQTTSCIYVFFTNKFIWNILNLRIQSY